MSTETTNNIHQTETTTSEQTQEVVTTETSTETTTSGDQTTPETSGTNAEETASSTTTVSSTETSGEGDQTTSETQVFDNSLPEILNFKPELGEETATSTTTTQETQAQSTFMNEISEAIRNADYKKVQELAAKLTPPNLASKVTTEPEYVYKEKLKEQFPTATEEQLSEAYDEWLNGREQPTLNQLSELQSWAKSKDESFKLPDIPQPEKVDPAKAAKEFEDATNKWKSELVGKRVFGKDKDTGGYVITEQDANEVFDQLAQFDKIWSSKSISNQDKLLASFNLFAFGKLGTKVIQNTLGSVYTNAKIEGLKHKANVQAPSSQAAIPPSAVKPATTRQEILRREAEHLKTTYGE